MKACRIPTGNLVCSFHPLLPLLLVLVSAADSAAQVNSWTNDASGKWESTNWLLGIPPATDQSVQIWNDGWKAIAIDPDTVANAPETLTVSNLLVRSYSQSVNTLLLNYAGTDLPLRVKTNLTIGANGVLMNLHSGLIVDDGGINIVTGKLVQDGGFVIATNTSVFLTGVYELTNGILQVSDIYLGGSSSGALNQYGGTASANWIQVGDRDYNATGTGTYTLNGGTLTAGGIFVAGQNTYSPFIQNGGTNSVGSLTVGGLYNQLFAANYSLNGGTLIASNTAVSGTLYAQGRFTQSGGRHVIQNRLWLGGDSSHGITFYPARYLMTGGELVAKTLHIDSYAMFALTNGAVSIQEEIGFLGRSLHRETCFLAGATLACSNIYYTGIGHNITQTAGTLIVTNLFSFGGPSDVNPAIATYNFLGGTLSASSIEMNSAMIIGGDGQFERISNPGFFKLGGTLTVSNVVEHLGRFILASNATINLAGSARLAFADSSAEAWAGNSKLSVLNWDGDTKGGGSDQLIFGNSCGGLGSNQLTRIQFANPAGFPPGTNYHARMLASGEVVPVFMRPSLDSVCDGKNLVLTWPENCFLQAATNVAGPFVEYPELHCPITVDTRVGSQWFFRIRQAY